MKKKELLSEIDDLERLVTFWADKHGELRHELAVARELVGKLNGKVSALESRFLAEKEIVRQLRTSNSYAVYEDLTEQLEELRAECERLETSNQTAHKLEIAWATKYEEECKAHKVTKYELARISQIADDWRTSASRRTEEKLEAEEKLASVILERQQLSDENTSLLATVKDLEAVCWSLEEKLSMSKHRKPVVTIEYNGRKRTMSPGDKFEMTHIATVVYE